MIINGIPFITDLSTILNELKDQLILNNIELLGTIRDSGDNLMVSCPYHKNGAERKPSCGIRKSDGQVHCFTCGATHSLQEMISHCFGYANDLVGAKGWEWLCKNFLTVSIEERKGIDLDVERNSCSISNSDKYSSNYISDEEIDKYIATKEPLDKAGAYAIQGLAGKFVKSINGSVSNIIGLPTEQLYEVLLQENLV